MDLVLGLMWIQVLGPMWGRAKVLVLDLVMVPVQVLDLVLGLAWGQVLDLLLGQELGLEQGLALGPGAGVGPGVDPGAALGPSTLDLPATAHRHAGSGERALEHHLHPLPRDPR